MKTSSEKTHNAMFSSSSQTIKMYQMPSINYFLLLTPIQSATCPVLNMWHSGRKWTRPVCKRCKEPEGKKTLKALQNPAKMPSLMKISRQDCSQSHQITAHNWGGLTAILWNQAARSLWSALMFYITKQRLNGWTPGLA